jgi:drug/metabolite transporter (DMT)-like permease
MMRKGKHNLSSFLEINFVVILFGFTAILGKLIHISAQEVVFYRTFLACFGLGILLIILNIDARLQQGQAARMLATGLIVALHWFLFFYAARISNVSISLVGLATSTLWVALLEPFIDRKKISYLEVSLGIVVLVGLYLIFQNSFNHWLGLLLSVGSAFFQAVFSIINSKFTKRHHSLVITFYEMAGACITSGLFLILLWYKYPISLPNAFWPKTTDWFWLMVLAIVCTVYAYSAIVRLLKNLSAFSVNLVINLEPIYGIILAYFIFGESEKMSIGFYTGTTIICLAVFGYQAFGKKK